MQSFPCPSIWVSWELQLGIEAIDWVACYSNVVLLIDCIFIFNCVLIKEQQNPNLPRLDFLYSLLVGMWISMAMRSGFSLPSSSPLSHVHSFSFPLENWSLRFCITHVECYNLCSSIGENYNLQPILLLSIFLMVIIIVILNLYINK